MVEESYDQGVVWPRGVRAAAAVTFDVDGESAVLAMDSAASRRMSVMSHQAYGPKVGVPRLLRLLERRSVRATFFVPGYTAERYPNVVRSIVDGGHEIGHHGYLHETVVGLSYEAERDILRRGCDVLENLTGSRPVGYRAPMWELNYRTPGLLSSEGFSYDSSLMDDDLPYVLAAGAGPDDAIVEVPIYWGLDDWGQYCYLPGISGTGMMSSPDSVTKMWISELEAVLNEKGCFVLVNHPFLSGRPARAAALERLIERMRSMEDLWVAPLCEIAQHVSALGLVSRWCGPLVESLDD